MNTVYTLPIHIGKQQFRGEIIEKIDHFSLELSYINDCPIRTFVTKALSLLPDYFWEAAASSTGKYHPAYALGAGGLVRHTKAAVGFAHWIFELEQSQNDFTQDERDLIIAALILHDGWKHGNGNSQYTTFEHPALCADWVMRCHELDGVISSEFRERISMNICSHMGQWNTSSRSKVVLAKPSDKCQKITHLCDYLASRKNLIFEFPEGDEERKEAAKEDRNAYRLAFGKYKGELLIDIEKSHPDYIEWIKANTTLREPLKAFLEIKGGV